jgi:hypothetical protein
LSRGWVIRDGEAETEADAYLAAANTIEAFQYSYLKLKQRKAA